MNFKRLEFKEREEIERLLKLGFSVRSISKQINRSCTAVAQDIRKNGTIYEYCAKKAESSANQRKLNRGISLSKKITEEKLQSLKELLEQGWSINKIRYFLGISYETLQKYMKEKDIIPKEQPSIDDRLSALEAQIEIIIQQMEKND